jgi:hypothetical protein
MFRMGKGMAAEPRLRSDLVLLCGGTEPERAKARRRHARVAGGSAPVVVGDLESLMRRAPQSRVVIICGGLAGLSSYYVEQLIKQRAPQATLVRADRAPGPTGPAHRRGRRPVLRRLRGAAAIPH